MPVIKNKLRKEEVEKVNPKAKLDSKAKTTARASKKKK
jgi:hypothetical protein